MPVLTRLNTAIRTQRAERSLGIDALSDLLDQYLPAQQVEQVRQAYDFGAKLHEGQFRKSGEPYIYHPLAVARILAEMHLDATTLCAAILHDTVEDTAVTTAEVAAMFGDDVAAMVEGVSKLDQAQHQTKAEVRAESVRKLLLAMTQDIRVILVKLADRLHNMRTLGSMKPVSRRRIARETLDIYAPIAQRLGINTMRRELEELGFRSLYPNRYQVLTAAVESVTGERKNLIKKVEATLNKALQNAGVPAKVIGRRKNLYSLYLKMRDKHKRFLDIRDLYAFRIIAERNDDCYRALGIVHHVYKPISEEFNDYVASPKVNGYQSLHTTVIGPGGIKLEVQIRTEDMHHIAESGIAAHWQYKLAGASASKPQVRAREWLSSFLDMEQAAENSLEFLENIKVDLFPDEVYVFTPKGHIQRLPRGATPVDFAYAVHTELGNHAVACRVNHQLAPLTAQLSNGQMVEIIRSKHGQPNAAWLDSVKTAKARTGIRGYLKNLREDEAVRLGKRLLERALSDVGLKTKRLRSSSAGDVLTAFGLEDMESLYASIGLGKRLAAVVARHFLPHDAAPDRGASAPDGTPLSILGTEGLVVDYANCCRPIPGDSIRGHVSTGRGIVIHRGECPVGLAQSKKRVDSVSVAWSPDVEGDFFAELRVQGENQQGFLARVSTEIASEQCSIESISLADRSGTTSDMRVLMSVTGNAHLARVMRSLRRLPMVDQVSRLGP